MKIGSLFSGYGGLDSAVVELLGGEVAWHCEWDDAPARILAHHFPGVPNYRDVSTVDWASVEPVDVLTGGFPCQDVSLAGRRAGMKSGTRSGLWSEFATAIDVLRPRLVVIENVRGLLSAAAGGDVEPCAWCLGDDGGEPALRALGAVLGELADLGYDAEWLGVRASDVGAPHGRFRVFVVAYPSGGGGGGWPSESRQAGGDYAVIGSGAGGTGARAALADTRSGKRCQCATLSEQRRGIRRAEESDVSRRESGVVANTDGRRRGELDAHVGGLSVADKNSGGTVWGDYEPAIQRWEGITNRLAPAPTLADGRDGQHRLSALFVEWMMGLPEGWVTAPEIGLTRNQQLRALGNGVVPQQAAFALRELLAVRA